MKPLRSFIHKFSLFLLQVRCFLVLRFGLLRCEMQMISDHGFKWRSCVFDAQVVELLKMFDDFHNMVWWYGWPNKKDRK